MLVPSNIILGLADTFIPAPMNITPILLNVTPGLINDFGSTFSIYQLTITLGLA